MTVFARKKPVTIETMRYNGDNAQEVMIFCGGSACQEYDGTLKIHTLEGDMTVSNGDMVIKGVNGEFYPCRYDIFMKTYDIVDVTANQAQAIDPAEKPQSFSWALQWLKDGHKVARLGWNGKNQWVTMQNGSTVLGTQMRNENSKKFYGDRSVTIRPHLDIKTADDSYVCGWVPSTGDLFADDWVIVKDQNSFADIVAECDKEHASKMNHNKVFDWLKEIHDSKMKGARLIKDKKQIEDEMRLPNNDCNIFSSCSALLKQLIPEADNIAFDIYEVTAEEPERYVKITVYSGDIFATQEIPEKRLNSLSECNWLADLFKDNLEAAKSYKDKERVAKG